VPANAGPSVLNRPHRITVDVDIPKDGAEGALLSADDVQGGYCFYVQGGKLHYVYNYVGSQFFHVESNVPVPEGRRKLRFDDLIEQRIVLLIHYATRLVGVVPRHDLCDALGSF